MGAGARGGFSQISQGAHFRSDGVHGVGQQRPFVTTAVLGDISISTGAKRALWFLPP